MPAPASSFKPDILRILAWSVALPVLCVWPFLSAMPAFALVGGGLSTLAISINVVMLVTGFWPLLAAGIVFAFLRTGAQLETRARFEEHGLLLGAYAAVWTALYVIVAFANP
jgi:hypothetical protein